MELNWTVEVFADFPDDDINRLCVFAEENNFDVSALTLEIMKVVYDFEDEASYLWSSRQTRSIIDEIKRRCGGVQLNMFKELGLV